MNTMPERLHDAIENERCGNLSRAEALLGCLADSMEFGDKDLITTPDYTEVVKLARELVRASINKLDSLYLDQLLTDSPPSGPQLTKVKRRETKRDLKGRR